MKSVPLPQCRLMQMFSLGGHPKPANEGHVLAAIRKRIFLTTAGIYSMGWSWGWRCGAV